jgi:hypothetical protein
MHARMLFIQNALDYFCTLVSYAVKMFMKVSNGFNFKTNFCFGFSLGWQRMASILQQCRIEIYNHLYFTALSNLRVYDH